MKANSRTRPARSAMLLALAATLAMLLGMVGPPGAGAQGPDRPEQASCSSGRTVPVDKISIQLWTFNRYIGSGVDGEAGAPGPEATRVERLEYVFAFLSEVGYRNVEPYDLYGLTAAQFAALADEYSLKVPSRHMSTSEANWAANLADAKVLGQHFVGSGGFAAPGIGSYENVLATAATLNRLGERSVKNGTGPIFGHNHTAEFETKYVDTQGDGTLKSAWQILVENTDPRFVDFQLDVGWATWAGEDPASCSSSSATASARSTSRTSPTSACPPSTRRRSVRARSTGPRCSPQHRARSATTRSSRIRRCSRSRSPRRASSTSTAWSSDPPQRGAVA